MNELGGVSNSRSCLPRLPAISGRDRSLRFTLVSASPVAQFGSLSCFTHDESHQDHFRITGCRMGHPADSEATCYSLGGFERLQHGPSVRIRSGHFARFSHQFFPIPQRFQVVRGSGLAGLTRHWSELTYGSYGTDRANGTNGN